MSGDTAERSVHDMADQIPHIAEFDIRSALRKLRSTQRNTLLSLQRKRNAYRFKRAGKELHVEFVNQYIGMFAQLNFCLYMARYVESSGQCLKITLSSENYIDPDHGPNWFDYFFFHKNSESGRRKPLKIWDNSQLPLTWSGLGLKDANRIFFSQFGVRSEILQAVDDFVQKNGVGKHTIGVHYRGTDKSIEAAPVEIAVALDKVRSAVSSGGDWRNIFVASDVAAFVAAAQIHFSDLQVAYLDDSVRSNGNDPVHLGAARVGNHAMGRDALLNALVLSRCGSLIRTTSLLSAWASIFNPSLPVFLLNEPYSEKLWFPEVAILPFAKRL